MFLLCSVSWVLFRQCKVTTLVQPIRELLKQLKNTLRAHRKRKKDKVNRAIVTTNLSRNAHVILRELSKHYQVTQSEIIVKYLDKEFAKISKK